MSRGIWLGSDVLVRYDDYWYTCEVPSFGGLVFARPEGYDTTKPFDICTREDSELTTRRILGEGSSCFHMDESCKTKLYKAITRKRNLVAGGLLKQALLRACKNENLEKEFRTDAVPWDALGGGVIWRRETRDI